MQKSIAITTSGRLSSSEQHGDREKREISGCAQADEEGYETFGEVMPMRHIVSRPIIESPPPCRRHEPRTLPPIQMPFPDVPGAVPRALQLGRQGLFPERQQHVIMRHS